MEALEAPELKPDAIFTDRKNRRVRAWRFVFSLLLLASLGAFAYFAWLWFTPRIAKFGLSILWVNGKIVLILLPFVLFLLFWLLFANLPRKKPLFPCPRTVSVKNPGDRTRNCAGTLWKHCG
jgi:hypothetical protein